MGAAQLPEAEMSALVEAVLRELRTQMPGAPEAAEQAAAGAAGRAAEQGQAARSSADPLGVGRSDSAGGPQLTASEELRQRSTATLVPYSARPRSASPRDLFSPGG